MCEIGENQVPLHPNDIPKSFEKEQRVMPEHHLIV
jgi:hypothetical protein